LQGERKVEPAGRFVRVRLDASAGGSFGFADPSGAEQSAGKVCQKLGIAWCATRRLGKRVDRGIVVPQGLVGEGKIVPRVDVRWVCGDCSQNAGDGFCRTTALQEDYARVMKRRHMTRRCREHGFVCVEGLA
jgi:hypothetical protein